MTIGDYYFVFYKTATFLSVEGFKRLTSMHFICTEVLLECNPWDLYSKSMLYQWHNQEFFSGGGSTNSVEDRGQKERGSGGGIPLVRGSGGSCSLVQVISFHTVKFSQFLVL